MQTQFPSGPRKKQALEKLRAELRAVRAEAFRSDPRSRAGVACGQFLILIQCLNSGVLPKRASLLRFFSFVGAGAEQSREARP